MDTAPDDFLTVEDLAQLCRTSPGTIHYWRNQQRYRPEYVDKLPPAVQIGKRLLFRRSEVDAWLERVSERTPKAG
jgi:predicted DNA-binding transcriptional regulator AlpA